MLFEQVDGALGYFREHLQTALSFVVSLPGRSSGNTRWKPCGKRSSTPCATGTIWRPRMSRCVGMMTASFSLILAGCRPHCGWKNSSESTPQSRATASSPRCSSTSAGLSAGAGVSRKCSMSARQPVCPNRMLRQAQYKFCRAHRRLVGHLSSGCPDGRAPPVTRTK